jgi:hypothetical protein
MGFERLAKIYSTCRNDRIVYAPTLTQAAINSNNEFCEARGCKYIFVPQILKEPKIYDKKGVWWME